MGVTCGDRSTYIFNYNPLPFHEGDLPNKTIYRFCYKICNTTGATCGAGSAYPSGAPEITPSFLGGSCCLFFSFLCCVCYCCLFVFFILGHGVVSLFSIFEFDCPFGIFRPSFKQLRPPSRFFVYFMFLLSMGFDCLVVSIFLLFFSSTPTFYCKNFSKIVNIKLHEMLIGQFTCSFCFIKQINRNYNRQILTIDIDLVCSLLNGSMRSFRKFIARDF